jgi:hypothetical protein
MTSLILAVLMGADISGGVAVQPAPRLVMRYRLVYERVEKGETVKLAVGSDEPGYERVDDAPPVVKPGLYRCYSVNGVPTFERVEPVRKVVQFVGQTVGKAAGRVAEVCLPGRH